MSAANRKVTILRCAAIVAAGLLLIVTFADVNVTRVHALLARVGVAGFLLLLLPQFCSLFVESAGWCWAFANLGRSLPLLRVFQVRLSTEALAMSLPAGALICESTKPALLGRLCGVPVGESIAAMVARKYLLLASQAVYVLTLAGLGFGLLQGISRSALGLPGLGYVALGCGSAVALAALCIDRGLKQSSLAQSALAVLRRLPLSFVRRALEASAAHFGRTDDEISRYFRLPLRARLAPAVFFLLGWLLEAVETFVILRLLGVEVDFVTAASVEVVLSFVRNVVFVTPAGLGVQDGGYAAFLTALGIPNALTVSAAFVVLKRGKELVWTAVGYSLLAGAMHEFVPLNAPSRS